MLHAYRLVYPDSPHAPEMLWEWECEHIDRLLWNTKTFGREVVQCYFTDWNALAEENQRIWEMDYLPRPAYQPWDTWRAWLVEYREIVCNVQEIAEEHYRRIRTDPVQAPRRGGEKRGMDFQLQHDIPGEDLPEEWHAMLVRQARILEDMLERLAEAVTTVNSRADRTLGEVHQLHEILGTSERFLTTMAQQYIGCERATAHFQVISAGPGAGSPETAWPLHILDEVTAALHANLTTARQYLVAIRRAIEPPTHGA